MILPLGRLVGGIFGLLFQLLAILAWFYFGTLPVKHLWGSPKPLSTSDIVVDLILIAILWGLSIGVIWGLYSRISDAIENKRLVDWLKKNGEAIRTGYPPVFFRGRRVRWESQLICHHLVFSFIFISIHSKTRWLIRGEEPRNGPAWQASLYTLCYGWWGVPGIVWTFVALIRNLEGSSTMFVRDIIQPPPPEPLPQDFKGIMRYSFNKADKEFWLKD